MFLTVICLPFYFASRLPIEVDVTINSWSRRFINLYDWPALSFKMNKTARVFEFVAFHRWVSTNNKEKINAISGVKDKLGFTSFDWFELDMNHGLRITLEISAAFLLLYQAYLLYMNFWNAGNFELGISTWNSVGLKFKPSSSKFKLWTLNLKKHVAPLWTKSLMRQKAISLPWINKSICSFLKFVPEIISCNHPEAVA